jgi:hypothetical protein
MNMTINFHIETHGISLQYSNDADCFLLQEYKAEILEETPDAQINSISITTDHDEYFVEDAYMDVYKHLKAQMVQRCDNEKFTLQSPFHALAKGNTLAHCLTWLENLAEIKSTLAWFNRQLISEM